VDSRESQLNKSVRAVCLRGGRRMKTDGNGVSKSPARVGEILHHTISRGRAISTSLILIVVCYPAL
jgi:hypothetical protein